MHPITVRQATTADLNTLLRFEQGVINAERPYDSTLKDGLINYYDIGSLLQSEDALFLAAESGGRMVGCGFARLEAAKPYLKHARQAYLGLMYVEPGYRGQGINGKIIDALKSWCRSRHIVEMRLEVYDRNTAAVKAYEKAGFSKHIVEMRMPSRDE